MRHDAVSVDPMIREHPGSVRIAVPSAIFKLNAKLMETFRQIYDRCERPVEFCFFPFTTGLRFHHVAKRIREWLPDAAVYPAQNYNEYIADLNTCDLQLIAFPFGGTNSTMDALRQGIPIVALEGDEVHSRCDAGFIRGVGAPEWLIAGSEEEYIDAALRLIHDDHERVAVSREILQTDLDALYFDWRYEKQPRDFVELFWWVHQNHEAIQAQGRKVWPPEARALLPLT